jgi:thiol-disulfide isomerase/thioredoxin
MLSSWQDDTWFFVASGPNDQSFDVLVRLNPLAKRKPGNGVQTIVGGFGYMFHGRTWLMDDGEVLVALRTLESTYEAELARERIQKNLADGAPPRIDATSWLNTSDELNWDKLKGKVVLVDFWGTWCGPCVKKIPQVQALADKYRDRGLVVIGVHSADAADTCAEFVEKNKITFPIAIDSGKTAESFAIDAWPSVFLIDKTGKVVLGYTHDVPADELVENLLKQ